MKSICLFILNIFCANCSFSQIDSALLNKTTTLSTVSTPQTAPAKKPEFFNSGFIDFQNSGQMNASARIFKLYIGEPKKFMLPVSVYSGVSGNNPNTGNPTSTKGSEQLVLGLINPYSGLFNIGIDQGFRIAGKKDSLTRLSIILQLGERLLNGQQAISFKPFSFFSAYTNGGLLFQTGAWEKDKEKNMGVFWILARYHFVAVTNSFEKLSGFPPQKKHFKGFSIGMGFEINNVISVKSYYYRYINPGADNFLIPIYQLTFNYTLAQAQSAR